VLFGWYIISVCLIFTIYYSFYWSYQPAPIPIQSVSVTLGWPNQGPVFPSEFYQISITLSFYNHSITQNQKVIISSSGQISAKLTKGLLGIEVNYQKTVPFALPGMRAGHEIDLYLYPVNSTISPEIDDLVQQLPATNAVKWELPGTDYPTVTLLFRNGTMLSHPYPDQSLYVQPETATNDMINGEINFQREFGIILVSVIFGSIDAILEKGYQIFGRKEA